MSRRGPPGLRRIIFWQPIESPHQHDFLETLAGVFPGDVLLGVEAALPACRVAQGWRHVPHRQVQVVDVSTAEGFAALASHRGADALHVFSGFFSHPIVWSAFARLAGSTARLAVLTEAPEQGPWTGWLKRARGRRLVRRWEPRIELVLAMGEVGRRFFESIGFPSQKVVGFGYYLDVPGSPWPQVEASDDSDFRFIAVGQLIRRKGPDLLLEALSELDDRPWRCDFHGAGPLEGVLRRWNARSPRSDRIHFHPPVDNTTVRRALAASDCCVVPSRHDGWGMVVNEALIAGTPVVCTDGCGAADLIDDPVAGTVVPAGRSGPLAEALRSRLTAGKIGRAERCRVHAVALRHDPAAAARLFLASLPQNASPDR